MSNIYDEVLVYDIESRVYGKPDPENDKLKIFGCYSYKTNKVYLLTKHDDIQRIINAHKFLVGFNNEQYDNPILIREGIDIKYKIIIDLRKIIKQRSGAMKDKNGEILNYVLMEYSLDFITKALGVVNETDSKMKIDYKLFQKDNWSKEELELISSYTKRDIEVTKKLYEWVENEFVSFRSFINKDDVDKKVYLTAKLAKFTYKAICKAMNWKEQYTKDFVEDEESISGGYVSYPAGEYFKDDIWCFDFASLYPHIMMQCNLYGRKKEGEINNRPTWNGNNIWNVEGHYYSDKMSDVGLLIKKWYNDRVIFKQQKDKREYTIKIIINTMYGLLDNQYYSLVFDKIASGDCTRIGRQWIKYVRKEMKKQNIEVLYSDTDSIYVLDKDKEKLFEIINRCVEYIKSTVPFPQETFKMGIDAQIKYMFFFKGGGQEEKDSDKEMDEDDFINKPKGFMKKNYIYVTTDGKVRIKNLGIKKKSNSELSKKIFNDYLVPKIKEGQIKFSKVYIRNIILELLQKDINLAALRKEVGEVNQYNKSPTGLQAQIARKYGSGVHFLIPNTKGIGTGKGKSFCTVEEFNEHKLTINDIELDNVWKELDYFIKQPIIKNIFDY